MTQPRSVVEGLAAVRSRIAAASDRVGRRADGVELVAVSKKQPAAAVRAAYAAGQRVFGESYVQEMVVKAAELVDLADLRWHLVGHLQRNKVKHAVGLAAVVQTVDSARLADTLAQRAAYLGQRLRVLVEVNVGGEAQKAGCEPSVLGAIIDAMKGHAELDLVGLMTVPPWTEDPEASRPPFRRLAALAAEHGLGELSMGMSHDLEVAIEEGATIVRVGTAIFGERPDD